MCCVEQLPVTQPAYRTRVFIGVQHSDSEERLVQALVHQHREVCAPWSIRQGGSRRSDVRDVLSEDREGESGGVVSDHVDGPLGVIEARTVTVEVDERDVLCHGSTKTCIVRMASVRASVSVVDTLVRRLVLIRPFLAGISGTVVMLSGSSQIAGLKIP